MPQTDRDIMLKWLKRRWLNGRWLRNVIHLFAGLLLVVSIFASFASAIIASGVVPIDRGWVIFIAALPGVCLTIWRQVPFQQWASFENLRYVLYREIYFSLKYGAIDLLEAVGRVNAAGREIGKAADRLPYFSLSDETHSGAGDTSKTS